MRLISCHIENFGKMSEVSLDFDSGLNRVCRANGWGKSTLAAFLKVMFYGFDNEKSRDAYVNERKRFKPWQGGVYGGSLTFETGGRKYTVSRVFGAKEREDGFELRDAGTNMPSSDFSRNIGEELFKIDGASFMRTVFISQNDCMTSTTDRINAKLGNLAENTDDINNYMRADGTLKDMLNGMSPTRSTGKLYKMKARIAALEETVRGEAALEAEAAGISAERNECIRSQESVRTEQQELLRRQEKLVRLKDIRALRDKYEALCGELAESEKAYAEAGAALPIEPDREELDAELAECSRIGKLRSRAELLKLTKEETAEFERLDNLFGGQPPETSETDSKFNLWSEYNNRKISLGDKKAALAGLEEEQSDKTAKPASGRHLIIPFIAGFAAVFAGIALFFSGRNTERALIGGGLVLAGIVCLAVIGLVFLAGKRRGAAGPTDNTAAERIEEMRREIEEDGNFISSAESEIKEFLGRFAPSYDPRAVPECLNRLRQQSSDYLGFKTRMGRYREAEEEYVRADAVITGYIKKLGLEPEEDRLGQLISIRDRAGELERCRARLDNARRARDSFIRDNDISGFKEIGNGIPAESTESINARLEELNSKQETLYERVAACDRELEKNSKRQEEIRTAGEELCGLKQDYARMNRSYRILEKTRELLAAADTAFTAKYMEPITRGFQKYLRLLDAPEGRDSLINAGIDAGVNLTVEEYGLQRDIRSLSTGYRDLTGICMRIALADAMYEGEKPFLIFDDPFVNLDEDKYERAGSFLKELEKEYQIVYFTCRNG